MDEFGMPVRMSVVELMMASNSIGESSEALDDRAFEERLSWKHSDAMALLRRIKEAGRSLPVDAPETAVVDVPLSREEVVLLSETTDVTLDYLDDWEFHTRTGVQPQEMRDFRARLRDLAAERTPGAGHQEP